MTRSSRICLSGYYLASWNIFQNLFEKNLRKLGQYYKEKMRRQIIPILSLLCCFSLARSISSSYPYRKSLVDQEQNLNQKLSSNFPKWIWATVITTTIRCYYVHLRSSLSSFILQQCHTGNLRIWLVLIPRPCALYRTTLKLDFHHPKKLVLSAWMEDL